MRALVNGDRDGFMERGKANTERGELPPYGHLVAIVIAGREGT